MGTAKIFEAGAFGLERSRTGTEHGGWGDNTSANPLDDSNGFPWLTYGNQFEIGTAKDNSVTSNAFETGSRIVSKSVDNDLGFHNRFLKVNEFFAWMFGWEGKAVEAVAFSVADNSAVYAIGDTVTDVDVKEYSFSRYEQYRDMEFNLLTLAIFFPTVPGDFPALASGTLTGTGSAAGTDLPFTNNSGTMYEHLFEISQDGRQLRDFTVDEKAALGSFYQTGDQRSLFGTLAKRYTEFQTRYSNVLCQKMDIKWAPSSLSTIDSGYLAFREERADTSVDFAATIDYSMPCELTDITNVIAHYQTQVEIGERDSPTMIEEGLTDFNISVGIPLQKLQDTISGVYLADPFLEGNYTIESSMTVSRMNSQKFQNYRDNLTKLRARISSNYGFSMQEILIKEFTLMKAGGDDSDVTMEPLDLSVNYSCTTHDFVDWLNGQTEVNGSPIVMRTRDFNKYNMLLGRDSAGTSI